MTLRTDHKQKVFLQYGFIYEYLNHDMEQMAVANGYKEKISLSIYYSVTLQASTIFNLFSFVSL